MPPDVLKIQVTQHFVSGSQLSPNATIKIHAVRNGIGGKGLKQGQRTGIKSTYTQRSQRSQCLPLVFAVVNISNQKDCSLRHCR
ncbi:hypothetical protein I7I48_00306 [Histoplasma ohiense]|nr:hypothetical protein I7I48_00306 [Histoplasma ohiense (nom. inval.)]